MKSFCLFNKICLLIIMAFSFNLSSAKNPSLEMRYVGCLKDWIEPDMTIKSSAQGFAMHGKYAFQFRNKGQCIIIDMKKKKAIKVFNLTGNKSHCNNANFSKVKYKKDSDFPLLYISECQEEKSCFVTDLYLNGTSKVVQRIFIDDADKFTCLDWCLDNDEGYIYTFGSKGQNKKILRKFHMPKLSDSNEKGEVMMHAKDVLEEIVVEDFLISQGSYIHKGIAYLPEGYFPYERKLHVYDLRKKKELCVLNLNSVGKEPEGLGAKNGWLYVSLHQSRTPNGTSYIKFKL